MDASATAKKDLEEKEAIAATAKINKESAEVLKKDEAEIEVKKEIKAKKAAAARMKPEELQVPGYSPSEVWTANMPSHITDGFAQVAAKH